MSTRKAVTAAPRSGRLVPVASLWGRVARRPLARHGLWALLVAIGVVVFSYQVSAYTNYNLTGVAVFVIAAAGLTVLTGVNGQISLGHGALMAVGAYTTSLLLRSQPNLAMILVLLTSVATAAGAGLIFGVVAARLRGPYLAGATLALALALPQLALHFSSLFGGEEGIPVTPPFAPSWLGASFSSEQWLAWLAAGAALVTLVLLANLMRSWVGRSLKAVRDDEVAALLAGINVARTQVLAFVISAACAGLAGALFAYWVGLTAPAGFSVTLSLQLLIAIVIGGLGSLVGAVWGSLILIVVPDLTGSLASGLSLPSSIANNLPLAIFGLVLMVSILTFPSGIQGGLNRVAGLARSRWKQAGLRRQSG